MTDKNDAALSRPQDVHDGMVMVQKHDLEWIVAHVLDECDATGPCADLAARRVRALLSATPTAGQGGDGEVASRLRGLIAEIDPQRKPATGEFRLVADELKRILALVPTQVTPAPAAPVSERARSLSDAALIAGWEAKAAAYDRLGPDEEGGDPTGDKARTLRDCANELRSRADLANRQAREILGDVAGLTDPAFTEDGRLVGVGDALTALEQALTQQRGSVDWGSPFGPCACLGMNQCPGCNPNKAIEMARYIAANDERRKHPPCDECGAKTQSEAEAMCHCSGDKDDCHGCQLWPDTTPQPSAEGLRELVQRWRKAIGSGDANDPSDHGHDRALEICADQLESLLGTVSP